MGGSETYVFTLAKELKRLGHDVDVFTYVEGLVSNKIKELGVPIRLRDSYDLILANHRTCVDDVHEKGFTIQTCHSKRSSLEKPNPKAHKFISISQEIKETFELTGIQSDVILNSIDCERFSIQRPLRRRIKRVLSLSFSGKLNNELKEIFESKKIKFFARSKYNHPVWDIERYINTVDLVISLGRGCYESLSCGRPVLVLDERKYQGRLGDGLLTPENIDEAVKYNCSGRRYKREDANQMVEEALQQYDYHLQDYYRMYAENNLDVKKQVQKYLAIRQNL